LQRVLTTVTLLGLLVATAAAFAITEHLKLVKSDVAGVEIPLKVFSPTCRCDTSKATVGVRLRRAGHVTVTIHDAAGHRVATIASGVLMQPREQKLFPWDGRTDAGDLAPDGVYHPWIALRRQAFHLVNNITLDTRPPKVVSATTRTPKPVFFAGPGRTIAIRYTFDGKAHAVVYLGRRQIILGRKVQPIDKIKWAGTLGGRPLPAGKYVLSIGAQDRAGNETPAAQRTQVPVILRYIALTPARVTVRSGRRFTVHVETAAKRYTWHLGRRRGSHRGKTLHVRAPTTPGTYRLVVSENGHATTAVVRVRAK
jgi:flagellar hook capping protein FlgD